MPSTTADFLDIKNELIAGFPPGTEDFIDWLDPLGPGPLMEAAGHLFEDMGTAMVDALRLELSPLTCSLAGIAVWEQSCGLLNTKITMSGTPTQRRAQVIARLREFGQPTKTLIQTVLNAFLQYTDQTQIVILESDRWALRAANQVVNVTGDWLITTGSSSRSWVVWDDPHVSKGGAQIDLEVGAFTGGASFAFTGGNDTTCEFFIA